MLKVKANTRRTSKFLSSKIAFLLVSILASGVILYFWLGSSGFDPSRRANPLTVGEILQDPVGSQNPSLLSIGRLFGLSLSEPLPRNCRVLNSDTMENGKRAQWILLPSENPASNKVCWITFDGSDRRIASISGGNCTNESGEIKDALLTALRQRYGVENTHEFEGHNGYEFYEWGGTRAVRLWFGKTGHFSIECSDFQLVNQ